MRHAAQCVGRAIRGKTDYGLMIFADKVSLLQTPHLLAKFAVCESKCVCRGGSNTCGNTFYEPHKAV